MAEVRGPRPVGMLRMWDRSCGCGRNKGREGSSGEQKIGLWEVRRRYARLYTSHPSPHTRPAPIQQHPHHHTADPHHTPLHTIPPPQAPLPHLAGPHPQRPLPPSTEPAVTPRPGGHPQQGCWCLLAWRRQRGRQRRHRLKHQATVQAYSRTRQHGRMMVAVSESADAALGAWVAWWQQDSQYHKVASDPHIHFPCQSSCGT